MFTPVRTFFISITMGFLTLTQVQFAHAARHALLIGNDSYLEVPALRNARADAETMGAALQKAGYEVTVMKDRNLKEMKDDVREFKSHIKGGDEVFFFYSGHGVQIEAMNYLLPVDVRADSEDQVRDDALALSAVLSDLRTQKPALTLAVVDACRDNPFKGTGRAIGGRGLTGVGGANGQMVIYSAGEGQQALDRLSEGDPVKNGLFTRVFMKEMERPGVPIDQVARQVRAEVNRQALTVKHEQVPAIYDQVIGQFYFYAQNEASVDEVELVFWTSIKDSSDPAELKAYLEKYPDGQFSGLAGARINRLEQDQVSADKVPVSKSAQPAIQDDTKAPPIAAPVTQEAAATPEPAAPPAEEIKPPIVEPETKSAPETALSPTPDVAIPAAVAEQSPDAATEVKAPNQVEASTNPAPEKPQSPPEPVAEEQPPLAEITPARNARKQEPAQLEAAPTHVVPGPGEQPTISSTAPGESQAQPTPTQ